MMLHPSYADLIKAVNEGAEEDEEKAIDSRYSIVMAAAHRARQIISGHDPLVKADPEEKPLSIAVRELVEGKTRILTEEEREQEASVEPLPGLGGGPISGSIMPGDVELVDDSEMAGEFGEEPVDPDGLEGGPDSLDGYGDEREEMDDPAGDLTESPEEQDRPGGRRAEED